MLDGDDDDDVIVQDGSLGKNYPRSEVMLEAGATGTVVTCAWGEDAGGSDKGATGGGAGSNTGRPGDSSLGKNYPRSEVMLEAGATGTVVTCAWGADAGGSDKGATGGGVGSNTGRPGDSTVGPPSLELTLRKVAESKYSSALQKFGECRNQACIQRGWGEIKQDLYDVSMLECK